MVRHAIAEILQENCKDVKTEPALIPIDSDYNCNISGNLSSADCGVPFRRILWTLESSIQMYHHIEGNLSNHCIKIKKDQKAAYISRVIQVEKVLSLPWCFLLLVEWVMSVIEHYKE